jgi:hypothetical protein
METVEPRRVTPDGDSGAQEGSSGGPGWLPRMETVELPPLGVVMNKYLWDIHPHHPTNPHRTTIIDPECGFGGSSSSGEGARTPVRNIRV